MRRMALKLSVVVLALGSVSCGAANSLYQTSGRMLQAIGRTVGM